MNNEKVLPIKEAKTIVDSNNSLLKKYNELMIASKKISLKKISEADSKFELLNGEQEEYFNSRIVEFKELYASYQKKIKEEQKEKQILNYMVAMLVKSVSEDF